MKDRVAWRCSNCNRELKLSEWTYSQMAESGNPVCTCDEDMEYVPEIPENPEHKPTVFVATVEHKHGVNTYAAKSLEGIDRQIHEYVKENWFEVTALSRDDVPAECPDDVHDAIGTYFQLVESEYFNTTECELVD